MNHLVLAARRVLLASLATLVAFLLSVLVALFYGISWEKMSFGGVSLEQGELRLERKLELEIERVSVHRKTDGKETTQGVPDPALLKKLLHLLDLLEHVVSSIDIRKIELGDVEARFSYRENGSGRLQARGEQLSVSMAIHSENDKLLIDVIEVKALNAAVMVSGDISIDVGRLELQAQLTTLLADTLSVSVAIQADRKHITFKGKGDAPVAEIAPIVALFELGPTVTPWISDYLHASQYTLRSFSGSLPYDEPAAILQTLRAEALVVDTEYTFAQGLEPALAAETQVVFEKGVLNIHPHDSTFYGQDGGDTWVDIDFNNPDDFMLGVHVRTQAQASGGLVELLKYYGVPFPLEQLKGLTDTQLDIMLGLKTSALSADGHFVAQASKFRIGSQQFDVEQLEVDLKNTLVTIGKLDIGIPGLLSAAVEGTIDPADGTGKLDIALQGFSWQDELELANPLDVIYRMQPAGDSISLESSTWSAGGQQLVLDAFTTAFDPGNLSGTLEAVGVRIEPWLQVSVSGKYQGEQKPYATLDVRLQKLAGERLQLQQAGADIEVLIDSSTLISTSQATSLQFDGVDIVFQPVRVTYANGSLDFSATDFSLGNRLGGTLQGRNILSEQSASVILRDPEIIDAEGHALLKSGNFDMRSIGKGTAYRLTGSLHSTASGSLLQRDGKPVEEYRFDGTFEGGQLVLDVNDSIELIWSDKLHINTRDIDFDLPLIISALGGPDATGGGAQDSDNTTAGVSDSFELSLQAQNSGVWLDQKTRIPADSLSLSVTGGKLAAQLDYGDGSTVLSYDGGQILAAGAGFGSDFFNPIITLADFEGGTMQFNVEGSVEDLHATVRFDDTVIKNFKHLNNMLAFVNTLPGLLTFNPPKYSKEGLPVREVYLEADVGGTDIEVQALLLDSRELSLAGEGQIDLDKETTDMTFKMDGGVKKSIDRIPLVGYVLTGGKKKSMLVLQVKGDMHDPDVSNSAAKDAVTYPLQLVKRTLLLPAHVLEQAKGGAVPE